MSETAYYVISFESTSETMESEKLLNDSGVEHALMPTPRAVQASCGLSVRVPESEFKRASALIAGSLAEGRYHCYIAFRDEGGHISYEML